MAATRPVLCILLIGCALGGVLAAVTGEDSSGGGVEVKNLTGVLAAVTGEDNSGGKVGVQNLTGVLAAVTGEHSSGGKDEVQNLMSQFNLTQDEVAEFKEGFMLYDKDNDGIITKAELCVMMRSLGQNPTETELTEIMTEWDLDKNGTIELNEYIAMMVKKSKEPLDESELQEIFHIFDKKNKGYISFDDLREMMALLGENLTDEQVNGMINEVDQNNNKRVEYEELVTYLTSKK